MSTRRRIGRERYTVPQRRPRGELLKTVGGVAAVVVGTLVMVWLLRPGTGSASGGLVSRQPRAAWLIVLTASAALAAVSWLRRTRSRRIAARPVAALVAAMALVAVAAVAAGAMWPGGLLRHTPGGPPAPRFETETTLPAATSAPAANTTTPQSGSTVPAETTTPGAETTVPVETTTPGIEATAPVEATAPTETTGGP